MFEILDVCLRLLSDKQLGVSAVALGKLRVMD